MVLDTNVLFKSIKISIVNVTIIIIKLEYFFIVDYMI